jgi:hypothetical protein
MIKKTLYPKTKRVLYKNKVVITEKLDGSNIGFFKINGELLIAQRNNIFLMNELEENKQMLYKGLLGWLQEHGEDLKNRLIEGSGFFGEWIGMGKLKYPELDKKVYMFAKANYQKGEIKNLYYEHELFIYPFENQEFPEYIGIVPVVQERESQLNVEGLDLLYIYYTNKVNRNVEGFIIAQNNNVNKYVRMKNGKLQEHHE